MRKIFVFISLMALGLSAVAQEYINTKDFANKVWDYRKDSKSIVLKSKLPIVLDFYADWCRPCKMVAPELTQLQKDYKGKILVYKINIDQEKDLHRCLAYSLFQPYSLFARMVNILVLWGIGQTMS